MRLVDGICVVVAKLVHNLGYSVVVLRVECIPNETLELESSAFALVIELIIERFSYVRVHVGVLCVWSLHADTKAHGIRGQTA